jgi:drug/metabolite transporter (DMT)-like permease
MFIASFCFAFTGAVVRYLRDDFTPTQLVFYRNIIGVIYILYTLWKNPPNQKGGKLGLLIFRGLIGTFALMSFFYGIANIGLAVSITYQQSYPVFLAVLVAYTYNEVLTKQEWAAVLLGFIGVALIFLPGMIGVDLNWWSHLVGLCNAIFTGLAYFSIRGLKSYYDSKVIVLSFMLSGLILPIIGFGFYYLPGISLGALAQPFKSPEWSQLPFLFMLGIGAMIGQIFLTKAFSYERTGIIAAVGYSNIVFSILFGVFLSDPWPNSVGFLGILCIVLSGCYISFARKAEE